MSANEERAGLRFSRSPFWGSGLQWPLRRLKATGTFPGAGGAAAPYPRGKLAASDVPVAQKQRAASPAALLPSSHGDCGARTRQQRCTSIRPRQTNASSTSRVAVPSAPGTRIASRLPARRSQNCPSRPSRRCEDPCRLLPGNTRASLQSDRCRRPCAIGGERVGERPSAKKGRSHMTAILQTTQDGKAATPRPGPSP